MADRDRASATGPRPALARKPGGRPERSRAASVLRLQGSVGNAALSGLLLPRALARSPSAAEIAEALGEIKTTTAKRTVHQLAPWEIFALVSANTPKKKTLYKELRDAWGAVKAAQAHLDAANAAASAAPAPKAKHKHASPADPAAAAKALERAQARADRAVAAVQAFIRKDNDLKRRVKADERSIARRLRDARAGLAKLKQAKHPKAEKLADSAAAVASLVAEQSAIPQRYKDAETAVETQIAATSFAPHDLERTLYTFEIEGETVKLSDSVDAWSTKFGQGLDEAERGVASQLDDVLARTSLSASNQKIIHAISDNESGSSPWSAVNTYDRAVLTWGLVQWTGGSKSDLTKALAQIKTVAPESFEARFEKYGVDIVGDELVITAADGSTTKGDAAALSVLGSPQLSAVFSRAGYDTSFQEAEVAAAVAIEITEPMAGSFAVGQAGRLTFSDVLTSEFVVGLFADRVVNAGKGGTQSAVADAVRAYVKRKRVKPEDAATWAADLEPTLITLLSPYPSRVRPYTARGCSRAAGSYKP